MYLKKDITYQLEKMGAPKDRPVLMHSSLRSIGDVEGGAEGLLDTLMEYFTSEGGLLCIPTHTWAFLGDDRITLDLTANETNLGAFSKVALMDKRGIRTENPTHSMVIFGDRERAEAMAADEASLTSPTSPESSYGKLYSMDGYILLAGLNHNRNTYLHSVVEMLETPNRMGDKKVAVTVKRKTGEIIKREQYSTKGISTRFPKYETAFRYHRCIRDGFIGDAPSQLCSCRGMKEVMELIYSRSEGKDPLMDENQIEPRLYCRLK